MNNTGEREQFERKKDGGREFKSPLTMSPIASSWQTRLQEAGSNNFVTQFCSPEGKEKKKRKKKKRRRRRKEGMNENEVCHKLLYNYG